MVIYETVDNKSIIEILKAHPQIDAVLPLWADKRL
jgi:hypothetical protein